jgi:hypothetical protein
MSPKIPQEDPAIASARKLADEEANADRIKSAQQRAADDQERLFQVYGARAAYGSPSRMV